MHKHKSWVIATVYFLALLIALSVFPGSAHAAGQASTSDKKTYKIVKPASPPPGCYSQIELGERSTNYTYQGHNFFVYTYVYGWYVYLQSGRYAFCGKIFCNIGVGTSDTTSLPPGNQQVRDCGQPPASVGPLIWRAGGNNITYGAGLDVAGQPSPANVAGCAGYQPAGTSRWYEAGWGCLAGDDLLYVPGLI